MTTRWDDLPVVDLTVSEAWRDPGGAVQHLVEAGHRAAYVPSMDTPMLLRYDDILDALAGPDIGALGLGMLGLVGWNDGPFIESFRNWLVTLDPPDHDRLRRLVSGTFTPRRLAGLEPAARRIADDLADAITDLGEIDLYDAFAEPFALAVLAEALGVSAADHSLLGSFIHPIADALGTPSGAARLVADEAMTQFNDYIVDLIATRRRNPGDDLLTALIHAEQHGDQLTGDELVAMTAQLLFGGLETTRDLIGSAVYLLATHRTEEARVRCNPALIQRTVNETLRYEPPVTHIVRPARCDLALGGLDVPAGRFVVMNIASGNRDPQHWDRPERFDVTRAPTRVLSFGWGAHYCVGAAVARMEATIALDTLLSRFETIELRDPAPEWKLFTSVRSLDALRIHIAP